MEKRFVYFVLETQKDENGEFLVLCAVEGESGYRIMGGDPGQAPWHWGKDFEAAEAIAEMKNASLGLSKEDADAIVASTMRYPKVAP
jgi:hypothetical protein